MYVNTQCKTCFWEEMRFDEVSLYLLGIPLSLTWPCPGFEPCPRTVYGVDRELEWKADEGLVLCVFLKILGW